MEENAGPVQEITGKDWLGTGGFWFDRLTVGPCSLVSGKQKKNPRAIFGVAGTLQHDRTLKTRPVRGLRRIAREESVGAGSREV
ncbi:hypothetical protein N7478_008735 [Penicillium angulare]|uniref:uncharacterized protein n=1 Tax=Penicillium angulare TaxID=116970 RepID=UPI00254084B9|nr:uncharacterized protein N7478_008735 [Penicillium angulare]KAJ5273610.1 hypothetical protein N7478_008735 [Penicillium angulare]